VNAASFISLADGARLARLSNAQEDFPMRLSDIARRLPEEIWALFEPILPKVVYRGTGRHPATNHACLHGLLYVLITGIGWDYVPRGKTIQSRLRQWLTLDCFHQAWAELAQRYERFQGINWDQILLDGSKKPAKKGGEDTGPSPVDRSKAGSAIQLATDAYGMPLGAVITPAGANDGVQTQRLLEALVVHPPPPKSP
jgi:transposase